jgi:hypothetical protein
LGRAGSVEANSYLTRPSCHLKAAWLFYFPYTGRSLVKQKLVSQIKAVSIAFIPHMNPNRILTFKQQPFVQEAQK